MNEEAEPSSASERLRDMARRLAAARRLDGPGQLDADRVSGLLQVLQAELAGLQADQVRTMFRAELVALLDEATALRDRLQRERAGMAARLDVGGRHRRAGAAYQRARGG